MLLPLLEDRQRPLRLVHHPQDAVQHHVDVAPFVVWRLLLWRLLLLLLLLVALEQPIDVVGEIVSVVGCRPRLWVDSLLLAAMVRVYQGLFAC